VNDVSPMAQVEALSALFPEAQRVRIAGADILVREMPLRRLASFAQHLGPFLQVYSASSEGSAAMIRAAGPAVIIDALAVALERPSEWIESLSLADIESLLRAVQQINRDFFIDRGQPSRSAGRDTEAWGWADVVLLLHRYGFSAGDLTPRQARLFLEAIARSEREERALRLLDHRHAYWMADREFTRHVSALGGYAP
jgi:hypothetical protein